MKINFTCFLLLLLFKMLLLENLKYQIHILKKSMHSISIGQHCFRPVPPAWVSEWRTDGQRVKLASEDGIVPYRPSGETSSGWIQGRRGEI